MGIRNWNKNSNLPDRLSLGIGGMKLSRGTLNNDGDQEHEDVIQLYQWDAVPRCTREACPAFTECDYQDKRGKCKVQTYFIRHTCAMLYIGLTDLVRPKTKELSAYRTSKITMAQWFWIGVHIVPLYAMLSRIGVHLLDPDNGVSFLDGRGNRRANPLMKEWRETVKLISQLWKDGGLKDHLFAAPPPPPDMMAGGRKAAPDYYELLESEQGMPMKKQK